MGSGCCLCRANLGRHRLRSGCLPNRCDARDAVAGIVVSGDCRARSVDPPHAGDVAIREWGSWTGWCGRRGSNPHGYRRGILSPVLKLINPGFPGISIGNLGLSCQFWAQLWAPKSLCPYILLQVLCVHRSQTCIGAMCGRGEIGRRKALKMLRPSALRVQVPPPAPVHTNEYQDLPMTGAMTCV